MDDKRALEMRHVTNQHQLSLNEAMDIIEALTRLAGKHDFSKLIWENSLLAGDSVIRNLTAKNARAAYQRIASHLMGQR